MWLTALLNDAVQGKGNTVSKYIMVIASSNILTKITVHELFYIPYFLK